MLSNESLKDLLNRNEFSKTQKLLLCLASQVEKPKSVQEIVRIGTRAGLRGITNWNVSDILRKSRGRAILTDQGWELTSGGKEEVSSIVEPLLLSPRKIVSTSLRSHLTGISESQIRTFVQEAIACFEARHYRAAVVLSWVGALSLLYEYVVKNELPSFNAEAQRRNPKWKDAKTRDDLARMKEYDFLQILEGISVLGKV